MSWTKARIALNARAAKSVKARTRTEQAPRRAGSKQVARAVKGARR